MRTSTASSPNAPDAAISCRLRVAAGSATTLTRVESAPRPARASTAATLTLAGNWDMASAAVPSNIAVASEIDDGSMPDRAKNGAPLSESGCFVVVSTTVSSSPWTAFRQSIPATAPDGTMTVRPYCLHAPASTSNTAASSSAPTLMTSRSLRFCRTLRAEARTASCEAASTTMSTPGPDDKRCAFGTTSGLVDREDASDSARAASMSCTRTRRAAMRPESIAAAIWEPIAPQPSSATLLRGAEGSAMRPPRAAPSKALRPAGAACGGPQQAGRARGGRHAAHAFMAADGAHPQQGTIRARIRIPARPLPAPVRRHVNAASSLARQGQRSGLWPTAPPSASRSEISPHRRALSVSRRRGPCPLCAGIPARCDSACAPRAPASRPRLAP